MKKIKVLAPVQKKTLFGTKTVMKEQTIKVDDKTYKAMKKAEKKKRDKELEEMLLIVEAFSDD